MGLFFWIYLRNNQIQIKRPLPWPSSPNVSPHRAAIYKDKFYQLHQTLYKNMGNDIELTKKARKLQKQLNSEALKLEKAQQQQKEHEYRIKGLEERLDVVKKETNEVEERCQLLQQQISKHENEKVEKETEIAQKEVEKKNELIPEIERRRKAIEQLKLEI